jgi:hypothetical protein
MRDWRATVVNLLILHRASRATAASPSWGCILLNSSTLPSFILDPVAVVSFLRMTSGSFGVPNNPATTHMGGDGPTPGDADP